MRKYAEVLSKLLLLLTFILISLNLAMAGIPGDFNGDVTVDFQDLEFFTDQWLTQGGSTAPGVAAHWKFNETSGTTAYDSAGTNHGSVYGAVWSGGQLGGTLWFDGDDDYVDIGNFDLTDNWTICLWVRSENPYISPIGSMVFGNGNDNNNCFYIIPNNRVRFINASGQEASWTGDTNFYQLWRFVTLVASNTEVELFLDGVSQGSQTIDPEFEFYHIGTGFTITIYDFKGKIDDVQFYNRTLNSSEILDMANSGAPVADLDNSSAVELKDFAILASHWQEKGKALVINEFMADNKNDISDPQDQNDDWIELHNVSSLPVDVGGLYMTDNLSTPLKWQIPTGYPEETTIEPYGYLVLWADGDPCDGPLHLDFALSAGGEDVGLFTADGNELDSVIFDEQLEDMSYGRFPDADENFRYFGYPTAGAANNGGFLGLVDEVEFSHTRGHYNSPFSLALRCDTPGVDIRYTTNGSEPAGGTLYTVPININTTTCLKVYAYKTGWFSSEVFTQTYIFTDDVIYQTPPSGYPTLWDGYPADYLMDPDVYNNPEYSSLMTEALRSIPTLSIVTDQANLFDFDTGIYTNTREEGTLEDPDLWERPVSVEFFDPCSTEEFQIDCGLRISGNASRLPEKNPKHAFRLLFKGMYGPTKLRYPFYGPDGADKFDTLVLRSSFCNAWQHHDSTQRLRAQDIRDQWGRHAHLAMGDMSCRGRYVHLYLNGLYWGLYYPTERPSAPFWASYEGGEKEDYDTLKSEEDGSLPGVSHGIRAVDGDFNAWFDMFDLLESDMSDNTNYQRLLGNNPDGTPNLNYEKYLDVENLINYMIVNIYGGNTDWDEHNIWMGKSRVERTGFRFFVWDAEHVVKWNAQSQPVNENNPYHPSAVYAALRQNAEFRILFADRVYKHFYNGGALSIDPNNPYWDPEHPERNKAADLWMTFANQIDLAIIAESARWGDYRRDVHVSGTAYLYTKNDHWLPEQANTLSQFFPGRVDKLMLYLRNTQPGYPGLLYPKTKPPEFYIAGNLQHGGYVLVPDNILTMINPNAGGVIYYTLDGTDPRMMGGAIHPEALDYDQTGPVALTKSTLVKARVLRDGEWSALHEAIYAVGPVAESLRITELMYHPADPNPPGTYADDDYEYVELKNIGPSTIDLQFVRFTNGIDYQFPPDSSNTALASGQYVLVVKDPNAFAERYPNVNSQKVFGPYTGNLDNNDETIELVDANGTTIQEFEYEDNWRDITDGDGYSLTIINPDDPNLDNWNKKDSWRASAYIDGSPGTGDDGIIPNPGDIVINEVLTCSNVGADDWIELHNTTGTAIEISGWHLSDDSNDLTKYQVPPSTWIGVDGYSVFTEDHFTFGLSKNGEEVYLSSYHDANSNLTGYRNTEDFGAARRDITFGRHYRSSTDTYNFVAMDFPTYGYDNIAYPKVGPIVISEIMYNPEFIHPDAEYIELKNISSSTVVFDIQAVPWAFTDGIEFSFPLGTALAAGDYLLIVKDITAFEARYTAAPGVTVLEWDSGSLDNGGEKLELSMPGSMDGDERCYIRIDRVNYSDGSHPSDCPGNIDNWPTLADGGGKSLTKSGIALYGNDVANWTAENPSPGQ